MDAKKFTEIKTKIEESKKQKARAEGSLGEIKTRLKEEFGVEDIEAAEVKLEELEASIKKDEEKVGVLMDRLEDLTDWDAV